MIWEPSKCNCVSLDNPNEGLRVTVGYCDDPFLVLKMKYDFPRKIVGELKITVKDV
jgi:hypothetical protein